MNGDPRTTMSNRARRRFPKHRRLDIVAKLGHRAIILELKCLLPSLINKLPLEQQFVKVPAMINEL